ncbi:MAG: hypothetical protein ABSA13_17525 [Beijerinckiaceae bacterium]|jgi:hypothetical protein
MTIIGSEWKDVRHKAEKGQWQAIKPMMGVLNKRGISPFTMHAADVDAAQAHLAATRENKNPTALACTLRNRFADTINAVAAAHGLKIIPVARAPNWGDERAARLERLGDHVTGEIETVIAGRPAARRQRERAMLQRCALAMLDAGTPVATLRALMTKEALRTITDHFAAEDDPSPSRAVALCALYAAAKAYDDPAGLDNIEEARAGLPSAEPAISPAALLRLKPFRDPQKFRALLLHADLSLKKAAAAGIGMHDLFRAQAGFFIILSIMLLAMPKKLIEDVVFAEPDPLNPDDVPPLMSRATGKPIALGPHPRIADYVDFYYRTVVRRFDPAGKNLFIRPGGSRRQKASIVNSVSRLLASWDVDLTATDLRDLAVNQMIRRKLHTADEIAVIAGYVSAEKFLLRFCTMYDNEKRDPE